MHLNWLIPFANEQTANTDAVRKQNQLYLYVMYKEETLADVERPDFFYSQETKLKENDLILVYSPLENNLVYCRVISNVSGHVSVVVFNDQSLPPDASELVAGIIKIATKEQAQEGTDNSTAMTPLKVATVLAQKVSELKKYTDDTVNDNVGNGLVFGGDGYYLAESNAIVFYPKNMPSDFQFKNNYDYEVDLWIDNKSEKLDNTIMYISINNEIVPIYTIQNTNSTATYGIMKQVMDTKYQFGKRWVFRARYKELSNGNKGLVMISSIANVTYDMLENKPSINGVELSGNKTTDELGIVGYQPTLFTYQFSDVIKNDIQWLRGDTFSWQSGDVYVAAYDKLVEEYNAGGTEKTEQGVTFIETANGFRIALASQEANIVNAYDTYGIAWFYILDTSNNRFKLPRTKWGFVGIRDNVGKMVEAELPNIKSANKTGIGGRTSFSVGSDISPFVSIGDNSAGHGSGGNAYAGPYFGFDASKNNPIYKDGATVQPPATQMYLYFYVGGYAQSAAQQTAGLNAELFNAKADLDLNNAQPGQTFKDTAMGWGMPDYSAGIDISAYNSINNQFTAPCVGEVRGVVETYNGNGLFVNNICVARGNNNDTTARTQLIATVGKGDTIWIQNGTVLGPSDSRIGQTFYPMKGV